MQPRTFKSLISAASVVLTIGVFNTARRRWLAAGQTRRASVSTQIVAFVHFDDQAASGTFGQVASDDPPRHGARCLHR